MDLPLYLLGGLAAGGYFLNQQKTKNKNTKTNICKGVMGERRSPSGNILDHRQFDQVQALEESLAAKQFHASQNGGSVCTKIVPFYYRWVENSDLQRTKNPDYNPNALPDELACLSGGDMGTLPPLEKIERQGLVPELEGSDQNWAPIPFNLNNEIDRGPVRGHNNMVPFFGSNTKQNMNPDSVLASRKLEDFTGNRRLDRARKQEVEQLFAPVAQNLDQLVPLREKDRFVPSNLGKRNNELPFKQENVGPGLNSGYTSTPSGGFHNRVRILPKDNDALYVNPRTTHEGRVIRGKNPIDAPTSQSLMYKYKPETLVTNFDGERNFVTTGVVKNPTSRPRMDLKPTSRQQFTEYYASRGRNIFNTPENLFAKHKPSDRQNFKNTPFRNLEAVGGKRHKPDYTYNHENRRTERAVTGPRNLTTLSNLKAAAYKAYTALFDTAKKTRAESYIYHPRETGNVAASAGKKKGQVYNEASVAKTTHRETTEANSHTGYLAKSREEGPAQFTDEARTTTRELVENNSHTGNLRGQLRTRILNTLDQARTTGRETVETCDYMGGATGKKAGKVAFIDNAKTTTRETVEAGDYVGGATGRKAGKVALTDNAKTTTRETVDTGDYMGGVTGRKAGKVALTDTAKTTTRETVDVGDYMGGVTGRKAGKVALTDTAKTTTRETVDGGDYVGVATGRKAGQTALTDTAKTTIRETVDIGDYVGRVGKGRRSGRTALTDTAKTTGRETVDGGDYVGGVGKGRRAGKTTLTDTAKTTGRETVDGGDYVGGVGKGKRSGRTALTDTAKTTGRETIDGGDYVGGVAAGGTTGRHAPVTAHIDDAKTTHRETHEAASRIGPAQDPNLAGGRGYLTTQFEDKPTQRQFSHFSYTGNAAPKGLAESQRLYDEAYNMRQNINKEKVAKGRAQQNGYLPLHSGKTNTNINIKKLDTDRKNHYGFAPNPVFPNGRISESVCRLTSFKNNPPSEYSRLDTSLVESLLDNPLHKSLHSASGP